MILRKALTHGVAIALSGMLGACATSGAEKSQPVACETVDDCSEFAEELGRCAPEVYCVDYQCAGACPQACEGVDAFVNPCEDGSYICNEPTGPAERGARYFCTALPIACDAEEDCPLYRPDANGAWECSQGFCRFPGFAYASEPRDE